MAERQRVGLRLDPLDVLFFRDGRPFGAGAHGAGGLPTPQTLAGALRTALLTSHGFGPREFAEFSKRRKNNETAGDALREMNVPTGIVDCRFRGPWLMCEGEPVVAMPSVVVRPKGNDHPMRRLRPIDPARLPDWTGDRWPLWLRGEGDAKPVGGFLTVAGLKQFLSGDVPAERDAIRPTKLFEYEARTGIGINADTLTAAEGMIYSVRFLRLHRHVAFYAEALPGDEVPLKLDGATVPFGGEGRHVKVRKIDAVSWPSVASTGRSLWLLTTPAFHPPAWPGRVRAASSEHPLAVSGWDVALGGPRETRFAAPAGSVYFVDGDGALPEGAACQNEDMAQGWGCALKGVWADG